MDTTILPIYHKCDVCNYTSILKANYDRHLLTKKHLKNIEKHIEKIEEEAEKDLEDDSNDETCLFGGLKPSKSCIITNPIPTHEQLHNMVKDTYDEVNKKYEQYGFTKVHPDRCDYVYATKIYNTLYELKRQYPNKYQFVRNTNRMKREWERWSQEQYDCDYMYCYIKWFGKICKVNSELVGRFVY